MPVRDRELGGTQAAPLQIALHRRTTLRGLPQSARDGQYVLLSVRVRADQHEQRGLAGFEPGLDVGFRVPRMRGRRASVDEHTAAGRHPA